MLLVKLFCSSGSLLAVFPNSKIAVLINSTIPVLSSSVAVLLPNVSLKQLLRKKRNLVHCGQLLWNCSLLSHSVECLSVFLYVWGILNTQLNPVTNCITPFFSFLPIFHILSVQFLGMDHASRPMPKFCSYILSTLLSLLKGFIFHLWGHLFIFFCK